MKELASKLLSPGADGEKSSVIASVKQAFIFLIPIFMIGACAITIQSFPVASVRNFIQNAYNGSINKFLDIVYNATYGFAAVYLVISLSYHESIARTVHNDARIFATVSSTVCYFAFLGLDVYTGKTDLISYTKMSNIFSALLISLAATRLFFALYRLFRGGRSSHISAFTRGMYSVFPLLCCLTVFAVAAELISMIPGVSNFNDLVTWAISSPFETMGATYFSGLIIMLLESVLWVLGIHGGNVFDSLLSSDSNAFAFSNGQITTKPFIDTFALMGGCGTAICLLIALMLFSKDRKKKKICRLASIPMLFNINEILVFGLPVVLNPIYMIPFILTPVVAYSLAYGATALGLVPQIVNSAVHWTTPLIISGYQATGSIRGSILQLVLLLVGIGIYAPFVIIDNKVSKANESKYIDYLTKVCRSCESEGKSYRLDNENIVYKAFEDDIAAKLNADITGDRIYLQYQPQIKDGRIVAAEALLRFRYNGSERFMYPPLVVGIANNNGLFEQMSRAVVRRALLDLCSMQVYRHDFKIAANLRLDLLMNDSFRKWLIEEVDKSGAAPHTFGVEITEDAKLSDSADYVAVFNEIKSAGIEILMDDFSMGHTSISILQKNYFDYIKIDGNLIKQLSNERSQSIVSSIVHLGEELDFNVIAEYVETAEQRDMLLGMGCRIFQGYLYYKDMPGIELIELLQANDAKQAV